jgi:GNAT superfamily N-acetyltransferase
MEMNKLTDKNSKYFNIICDWQASWWGEDYKKEKVIEFMEHSLNENEIPQTYIAILDNSVVGMYQITMDDKIDVRPDYYPWLINVYVDEKHRGKGICDIMMKDAVSKYKELGIKRIYLHSDHVGLYEKYGWRFLEEVETLKGKIKRIYYIDIN